MRGVSPGTEAERLTVEHAGWAKSTGWGGVPSKQVQGDSDHEEGWVHAMMGGLIQTNIELELEYFGGLDPVIAWEHG